MDLFVACIRLDVWEVAKTRATVWSMSQHPSVEALTELKEFAKRSFHKLAMSHHPDKGGDQQVFVEIQQAYELIESATADNFVHALRIEKSSTATYCQPGAEQCRSCRKWSDVVQSCITVTCSGYEEPRKPRFANLHKVAANGAAS